MLNKEKYEKEILDIACHGFSIALVGDKVAGCQNSRCSECAFQYTSCRSGIEKWANSEYVEPSVDWAKVPVDTPILVRDYEKHEWIRRYFARYVNGKVFAWGGGATSWSTNDKNVVLWEYAKLAESEGK